MNAHHPNTTAAGNATGHSGTARSVVLTVWNPENDGPCDPWYSLDGQNIAESGQITDPDQFPMN